MLGVSLSRNPHARAPLAAHTPETQLSPQLPEDATAEIAVTKFNIVTKLGGNSQLSQKLDSDAPDDLNLYVMIYRAYKWQDEVTKRTSEEYLAYQETELSSGELKKGQSYLLDHAKWKRAFTARQVENASMGNKLLPQTISGNVTVSVGLSKNDALLGNGNGRLVGTAVKKEAWGDKTLTAEKQITVSLAGAPRHVVSLNPSNLDIGHRYVTAQLHTPLMPHYNPANKMAAMSQVVQLPPGTPFKVLQRKVFNGEVWYEVSADFNALDVFGWINSQAIAKPGAIDER
jgi:hypothetical protein